KAVLPVYYIIANAEAVTNHANLNGVAFGDRADGSTIEEIMIRSRSKGFSPEIKKRFLIGSYALSKDNQEYLFRKAQKVRRLIVNEVMNRLKEADAIIAPTASSVAPLVSEGKIDELNDENLICDSHLIIGNFAGLPSLSLPMGFSEGLPLGFSITANPFREEDMFAIAKAVEDHTGFAGLTKEDLL
ncbi:MAG: Asp-tRNA(Asn)/Glu-tRNA(Gln) amidotransferase subunit GatA, partial [Erysipelotrichaceae bacterium]|nr:Asp-tRNA(Asn)/Glu-tRNA(Gln) amidotransferase subunit GatA [Erysipelotrichaceae bacterium]